MILLTNVTPNKFNSIKRKTTKSKAESGKKPLHTVMGHRASTPQSESDVQLKTLPNFSASSKALGPSEDQLGALAAGRARGFSAPMAEAGFPRPLSPLLHVPLLQRRVTDLFVNSVAPMSMWETWPLGVASSENVSHLFEIFAHKRPHLYFHLSPTPRVLEVNHPLKCHHLKCHQIHRSFPNLLVIAKGRFL